MNAAASTQNTCERLAPVIILGVPRSGTTLLRVILGSHSTIFATAETPWITGSYGDNPAPPVAPSVVVPYPSR